MVIVMAKNWTNNFAKLIKIENHDMIRPSGGGIVTLGLSSGSV